MKNLDVEKPTEQNFNFLVSNNKYLKEEIVNREA